MRSFFEWFHAENVDPTKPWLILGKGPSFSKRDQFNLSGYLTLSLNHVVREMPVTVAHMIDSDVVDACGEVLLKNAQYVLLPWIPHVNNLPGSETLADIARRHDILGQLEGQGRLLYYNLSTGRKRNLDGPVVRVRYFSAEAAINLLATAHVRKVRSLGIDGGVNYGGEFNDLKDQTLLVNKRDTFDSQFQEIARTILTTGIDYAPLDVESPVRVFVGATDAQMLAVKVLEYSIRKHSSLSVEVFPLHHSPIRIPLPKDPKNRPRTPFSFQRFLIPALAGYRGRAIYVDSDMQVFTDIRKLWSLPFKGAELLTVQEPEESGRRPQFSVMLLDCSSLAWRIEEIVNQLDNNRLTYEQLMYEMALTVKILPSISADWNCLERYEKSNTALLHYTDMPTQPWVSRKNRWGYLWVRDLIEAVDVGFISISYVKDQIDKGFVRPSVLYQLARRKDDPTDLPVAARLMDGRFIPPYKNVDLENRAAKRSPGSVVEAVALKYYEKMATFVVTRKKRHARFQVNPSVVDTASV
jgi:hypothetical protein